MKMVNSLEDLAQSVRGLWMALLGWCPGRCNTARTSYSGGESGRV